MGVPVTAQPLRPWPAPGACDHLLAQEKLLLPPCFQTHHIVRPHLFMEIHMEHENNPYAPPESNLNIADTSEALPLQYVGSGTRFLNFLIDNIFCYILQASLGLLIVLIFREKGLNHLNASCIGNLYGILITVLYYSILEYRFGWTIGKLITKTRVITEIGTPITLPQAIGRSFARFVPFEPFSCFGTESRGWHDSWSKTYVVKRHAA